MWRASLSGSLQITKLKFSRGYSFLRLYTWGRLYIWIGLAKGEIWLLRKKKCLTILEENYADYWHFKHSLIWYLPEKVSREPDPYQFHVNNASPGEGSAFCYLYVSYPIWTSSSLRKPLFWFLFFTNFMADYLMSRWSAQTTSLPSALVQSGNNNQCYQELNQNTFRMQRQSSHSFQRRASMVFGWSSCRFLMCTPGPALRLSITYIAES